MLTRIIKVLKLKGIFNISLMSFYTPSEILEAEHKRKDFMERNEARKKIMDSIDTLLNSLRAFDFSGVSNIKEFIDIKLAKHSEVASFLRENILEAENLGYLNAEKFYQYSWKQAMEELAQLKSELSDLNRGIFNINTAANAQAFESMSQQVRKKIGETI